jgi:hypothetical protein
MKLVFVASPPRKKSRNWLARNQNNVSEWSDMSTRGLLFQGASTIKIQLSMLVLTPWLLMVHNDRDKYFASSSNVKNE